MNAQAPTERRPLPIGYQSFANLRNEGCYHVDKTPRFRGLDLHPHRDWSVRQPVVRPGFGGSVGTHEELHHAVLNHPYAIEPALDLQSLSPAATAPERLRSIRIRLPRATGQPVAVPVDEQDRPVLNVPQEHKNARTSRNRPGDVYRILKDAGEHLRVVFVTGITMVAEAGFPSGLNSLTDISLYPPLAAICAYTDHDLDAMATPELDRSRTRDNGYHWLGEEKPCNPHDILHLFSEHEFRGHWFMSEEPGCLYRMLTEGKASPMKLESCVVDASLVSNFELDACSSEALLFQSGHLTITKEEEQGSFNAELAEHLTGRGRKVETAGEDFLEAIGKADFPAFREQLQALLVKARCSCWNSGWRKTARQRNRFSTAPLPGSGNAAMPKSTGAMASQPTGSAWRLAGQTGTCWTGVSRDFDGMPDALSDDVSRLLQPHNAKTRASSNTDRYPIHPFTPENISYAPDFAPVCPCRRSLHGQTGAVLHFGLEPGHKRN